MTHEVQGTNSYHFLYATGVPFPIRFLFPNATSYSVLREVTQQALTQQMTCPGNVVEEKVGDSQEGWVKGQRKNSSK